LGYITHSLDLELTEDEAEAMVANWQQSLMHRQIEEICDGVTDDATRHDIEQLEENANAEFNQSVAGWCCQHAGWYGRMNPEDGMEEDGPEDAIE
jgi:ketosteroid isomerase-like protein